MANRIIIAVGRGTTSHAFAHEVAAELTDNWGVAGVHSLGDRSEVDDKERYIAFIVGEDHEQYTAEKMAGKIIAQGFSAAFFDDLEEAVEYAKERYAFGDEDAYDTKKAEEFREKMPELTAVEVEQIVLFNALFETGRVNISRARFNDEPVIAISSVVKGHDEVRATPLAILVSEGMREDLVLIWDL